jgi:hypothetical protein
LLRSLKPLIVRLEIGVFSIGSDSPGKGALADEEVLGGKDPDIGRDQIADGERLTTSPTTTSSSGISWG